MGSYRAFSRSRKIYTWQTSCYQSLAPWCRMPPGSFLLQTSKGPSLKKNAFVPAPLTSKAKKKAKTIEFYRILQNLRRGYSLE
jgi:hypothetical protein